MDLAAHRGNVTDPTSRLLDSLAIPVGRRLLVTQQQGGFAERGQEPGVRRLARLVALSGDLGEGQAGELPGFRAPSCQEGHGGGVYAWKRISMAFISRFIPCGRLGGVLDLEGVGRGALVPILVQSARETWGVDIERRL